MNKKILYLLFFVIVFSYFLWLNSGTNFSDPDSFYHAKIIELISDGGIIKDFNWLPFTSLDSIYIDHHLLYHLILVPVSGSLAGLKIITVVLAALVFVVFYWLLERWKIKYSWLYVLLMLSAHQFVFRMNLAKVPAVSVIFLLFFLYFLFKNNKWSWGLFIILFLYVWLYGGWPIMLGIGIIYWLISGRRIVKLINIASGAIGGLIINPYFPKNLLFYWQQTFEIGVKNYKNIIGVGGEWYNFNLVDLIGHEALVFIVFLLAIVVFIKNIDKQDEKSWLLLIISLIFLGLTLKSKRNVEYLIPFSILWSALVINGKAVEYKKRINDFINRQAVVASILIALLFLQIPIILGFHYFSLRGALQSGYKWGYLEGISEWIRQNSEVGDIVFHDDWADWPALFYYNDSNKYIIGLDPSFMYFKDKDKYWLWHDISTSKIENNICDKIKEEFEAKYVFIKKENEGMKENIEKDSKCEKVYEDEEGNVYKIL